MKKTMKSLIRILLAVVIVCMSAVSPFSGGMMYAEALENTVTANVAGDSDPYHIMRPAQTPALTSNLLSGHTPGWWGDGFTTETVTLHGGNSGSAYKCVNRDKDRATGLDYDVSTALKAGGTYVFSGWSKAAADVKKDQAPQGLFYSYTLVAELYFEDGTNFSYSSEFTIGEHGWEYRELSFTISKPLKNAWVRAYLRNPVTGTAWFDELKLVGVSGTNASTFQNRPVQTMRTAPGQSTQTTLSTKDGLSLGLGASTVTSLKLNGTEKANNAYSGFLVRDIAGTDDIYAFAPSGGSSASNFKGSQSTLGLNIDAKYEARDNCIAVNGTVKDATAAAKGRSVDLSFALPVSASGWKYGYDIHEDEVMATGKPGNVYKSLGDVSGPGFSVTDWDSAPHSIFPVSTIYNEELGLAIAVCMDYPTFWQLEYNGSTQQFVLTYQLGIVKEAPDAARFGFVIYRLDDPKYGFRAAMEKYTKIFPDYYTAREEEHGIWISGLLDVATIPDAKDFNFKFMRMHYDRDQPYTRRNSMAEVNLGVKSHLYQEAGCVWLDYRDAELLDSIDSFDNPSLDKIWSAVNELSVRRPTAQKPFDFLNRMAKSIVNGVGVLDLWGNMSWDPVSNPWAPDGVQLHVNANPKLPSPTMFDAHLGGDAWALAFDPLKSISYPFDGFSMDEMSAWWTGNANFNTEHFKYTTVPLTYSPFYEQPMLHRLSTNWEYAKYLSDGVHAMGKTMFANKVPDKVSFFTPLMDVMGTEGYALSGEDYWQPSVKAMSQWRTLSYQKPFCYLYSTDFNLFTTERMERYMQYFLLFGIFPSPQDSASDSQFVTYFESPLKWYERDRAIWKKYSPIFKAVSEAGWEPVTKASVSNSNLLIERYGNSADEGVYVVVHNPSSAKQTASVAIPAGQFFPKADCVYKEMISQKSYTLANNSYQVELAPYQTVVLSMLNPKAPENNNDNGGSSSGNENNSSKGNSSSAAGQNNNGSGTKETASARSFIFRGKIAGNDNKAVANADVRLILTADKNGNLPEGQTEFGTVTDGEGNFDFDSIPFGQYSLMVFDSDGNKLTAEEITFVWASSGAIDGNTIYVSGAGVSMQFKIDENGKLVFGKRTTITDVDNSKTVKTPFQMETWLIVLLCVAGAVLATAGGTVCGWFFWKRRKKTIEGTA